MYDELSGATDAMSSREIRSLLGAMLFSGDDVEKKVAVLSGGERARLALSKVLAHRNNTLLLDEPTNNLDIVAKDTLLEALKAFPGTVLLVSHDRFILNELVNEVVEVGRGHAIRYLGNYDDYLRKKAEMDLASAGQAAARITAAKASARAPVLASTNGIAQAERQRRTSRSMTSVPSSQSVPTIARRSGVTIRCRSAASSSKPASRERKPSAPSLASEMNDPNFYIQRKDADELIGRYQQLGREIERLYAELEKLEMRRRALRLSLKKPARLSRDTKSDYHSPSYLGCGVAKATGNKTSDRELVAAMAHGDADALRALSSRYARMLGALAYRFVKNESDAEEIAADALWQAWREAAHVRSARSSVSAWLVMLGRSRAIDRFRAARARRPPENPQPQPAPAADALIELEAAERAKIVKKAVGELEAARTRTSRTRVFLGPDSDGNRRKGRPSARHGENPNANRAHQVARRAEAAAISVMTHDELKALLPLAALDRLEPDEIREPARASRRMRANARPSCASSSMQSR